MKCAREGRESWADRGYEKYVQNNVSISKNVTACEHAINSFVTKSAVYQKNNHINHWKFGKLVLNVHNLQSLSNFHNLHMWGGIEEGACDRPNQTEIKNTEILHMMVKWNVLL